MPVNKDSFQLPDL